MSSTALVLSLTRAAQFWICSVFDQDVRARFVVQHSAQSVAVSGRCQPRSDTGLAHDVHIRALFDQQLKQSIPSTVRWTKEGVLTEGSDPSSAQAQLE